MWCLTRYTSGQRAAKLFYLIIRFGFGLHPLHLRLNWVEFVFKS
jgi:hypothetical protein